MAIKANFPPSVQKQKAGSLDPAFCFSQFSNCAVYYFSSAARTSAVFPDFEITQTMVFFRRTSSSTFR